MICRDLCEPCCAMASCLVNGVSYCAQPLKHFLTFTTATPATATTLHRRPLFLASLSSSSSSSSSSSPSSSSCSPNNNNNNNLCYNSINALFSRRMERFWAHSGIRKNNELVAYLQQYGMIRSNKVAQVMNRIDRKLFVPDGNPPYVDSPIEIGYNATISAPHMHASCLELLEQNLQPGMHALDIGSGSGYLTACFGLMVGSEGRAVGVEHIPELVASSFQNIENSAAAPLLKEGSLQVHVGDGRLGWPEFAPYDAIHVGAAAPEVPQPLIDQLKPGGRLVIPIGNIFQDLKLVDKKLDGTVTVRNEASVRFVPLTSKEAQLRDY